MNEKVHWLALRTGYVESNSNSVCMLYNNHGFNSLQEALEDIALAYLESAKREYLYGHTRNHCCRKPAKENTNFCSTCGLKIKTFDDSLTFDNIQDDFEHYINGICDDTYTLWEALEGHNWSTYMSNGGSRSLSSAARLRLSNVVHVAAYAESLLANVTLLAADKDPNAGNKLLVRNMYPYDIDAPESVVLQKQEDK